MAELIGRTLGNYRIDQLLGEGGMGSVYKGFDLSAAGCGDQIHSPTSCPQS